MIPIQLAVDNAVQFAKKVLEPGRSGEMLLEEVETAVIDDREFWLITLSVPRPKPTTLSFNTLGSMVGDRQYKTFKVDGETGEVLSMKIRQLSEART